MHPQRAALEQSLADPERFWSGHAERLHWHRKPSRALTRQMKTLPSGTQHEHWSWFPDGEISTTYNCVDRHVASGRGDQVAIIWESPVTHTTEKYTYAQLLDEVEVLAGVLREEGVRKGDVVIIYSMHATNTCRMEVESLTTGSADDSGRAHCSAGYYPAWGCSRCSLWRVRCEVSGTAD